jgi:hypothetical protein
MEPTTDRQRGAKSGRLFHSHARERLRILGEIPLRKFSGEHQPLDPDGNPDTSFLAKIPADTAFTFQTLDKRGLVLNFAQTWHQLRPGEIRTDCGGCHAHSQKPTHFALTEAAKPEYKLWDLTRQTPLVAAKAPTIGRGDSTRSADSVSSPTNGRGFVKYDAEGSTTVRIVEDGPANVEYHRDIAPILKRSCAACHTSEGGKEPAGKLDLAADGEKVQVDHHGTFPGTYTRLAMDGRAKFGHKPVRYDSWGYPQASRYIRQFQARRSLLVWKIFGERLDGFTNDDHPSESEPGAGDIVHKGEKLDPERHASRMDVDFTGSRMPPPEAVKEGKVQALSDEDRRTIARWIDLGCPIDLDYDPARAAERGYGWMLDDNRPVLTIARPREHESGPVDRILIGMDDYYTGLDPASFIVLADFEVNGKRTTENLAPQFKSLGDGRWELVLDPPLAKVKDARIAVSIRDKQGNTTSIERTFSVD